MNTELAERVLLFLVTDGRAMRTLSTKELDNGQFEAVAAAGWTVVHAQGKTKDEAIAQALDHYTAVCR